MDHLAQPSGRFTNRVRRTAVDLVINQSMTLEKATQRMRQKYHVHVPPTTLHDWVVVEADPDADRSWRTKPVSSKPVESKATPIQPEQETKMAEQPKNNWSKFIPNFLSREKDKKSRKLFG